MSLWMKSRRLLATKYSSSTVYDLLRQDLPGGSIGGVYASLIELFAPKPSDLWSASSIEDIERIQIVGDVVDKYNAQFEN